MGASPILPQVTGLVVNSRLTFARMKDSLIDVKRVASTGAFDDAPIHILRSNPQRTSSGKYKRWVMTTTTSLVSTLTLFVAVTVTEYVPAVVNR